LGKSFESWTSSPFTTTICDSAAALFSVAPGSTMMEDEERGRPGDTAPRTVPDSLPDLALLVSRDTCSVKFSSVETEGPPTRTKAESDKEQMPFHLVGVAYQKIGD